MCAGELDPYYDFPRRCPFEHRRGIAGGFVARDSNNGRTAATMTQKPNVIKKTHWASSIGPSLTYILHTFPYFSGFEPAGFGVVLASFAGDPDLGGSCVVT